MPSTEAPNWWADVQQERDELAGPGRRPADDWLGEEIDFVPRRRIARTADRTASAEGAGHPLHGVFVPAAPHASARDSARSITIELGGDAPVPVVTATPSGVAHELAYLSAADDPFASPPPPVGTRRTVQIKGRPEVGGLPSMARRHRPRTASDRVGHRPDRIALWAVALGAVLIILAAMTSSSQGAVPHRIATAPAVTATVGHAAHHAPAGFAVTHR